MLIHLTPMLVLQYKRLALLMLNCVRNSTLVPPVR